LNRGANLAEPVPVPVFLGLGSNLGDRARHLAFGLRQLEAHGRVTGVSSVYESDPVGYADQPPFLNLVARLHTRLEPRALLAAILDIERRRGRRRTFPNAPRTLDIDILTRGPGGAGGDAVPAGGTWPAVLEEPGLRVPHPRMAERPFVLVPLLELEPGLVDPRSGRAYAALLEERAPEARPGEGAGGSVHSDRPTGPWADDALAALGLRWVMDGTQLLEETHG
jgi:2-amino-4-hydroxy-6-hydroxymethyldihydropteridine diphosphokinase